MSKATQNTSVRDKLFKGFEDRGLIIISAQDMEPLEKLRDTIFTEAKELLGGKLGSINFQMCMHGGARDKKGTLWFASLAGMHPASLAGMRGQRGLRWHTYIPTVRTV